MAYHSNFQNVVDVGSWKWGEKKTCTTGSVYDHLNCGDRDNNFKHIRKSKISYKIKIFKCLLENNVVMTKDNMVKRNWTDNPTCMFCSQNETPVHLFFQCPVAKCVQGIVGACMGANYIPGRLGICTNTKYGYNICYQMGKLFTILAMQLYPGLSGSAGLDRKQIRHPAEIIICACTFMSYWVGLFSATVLRFRVRW